MAAEGHRQGRGGPYPVPPPRLCWRPFPGSQASEPPLPGRDQHPGPFPHPALPSPPSAQVYTVVDEMFLAGEIRETSQTKVLKQLLMLQSLE